MNLTSELFLNILCMVEKSILKLKIILMAHIFISKATLGRINFLQKGQIACTTMQQANSVLPRRGDFLQYPSLTSMQSYQHRLLLYRSIVVKFKTICITEGKTHRVKMIVILQEDVISGSEEPRSTVKVCSQLIPSLYQHRPNIFSSHTHLENMLSHSHLQLTMSVEAQC